MLKILCTAEFDQDYIENSRPLQKSGAEDSALIRISGRC